MPSQRVSHDWLSNCARTHRVMLLPRSKESYIPEDEATASLQVASFGGKNGR